MSKNSIIAFVLILATVALFTSPQYNKFYYEKILKKPYPQQIKDTKKTNEVLKEEQKTTKEIKSDRNENETTNIEKIKENEYEINKHDTIWVENEKTIIGIDKIGANIISVKLKEYKDSDTKQEIDIMDEIDKSGASITIDGKDYNNEYFEIKNSEEKKYKVERNEKKIIQFETENNEEKIIKEYEIGDDYSIGIKIIKANLPGKRIKIDWKSGIVETENKKTNNNQFEIRKANYYNGETVNNIEMDKDGNENSTGNFKWVGISSKYFFIAIVSDTISDADISIKGIIKEENSKKDKKNINYQISYEKTAEDSEVKYLIYAGPNKYEELKKYEIKFEKTLFPVVGFWKNILWADRWFPWIAEFVLWILLSLFKIFKDYGISIIILTLLSKIITYPLTHSSMKSMNRVKDVQPKIEAIRKKNKNNAKKLNEEIMALYKDEGINPLNIGGCLPIFLQMPIFFALFVVLKKAIELRGATTVLVPWIKDLSKAEAIITLGSPLPMYGDNIAIIPIIMAVLTYFQNKMTMKDPNQKAMIYIMPIFMLALFNAFPSGLVIYWTFQSALALVQQLIIDKTKKKTK